MVLTSVCFQMESQDDKHPDLPSLREPVGRNPERQRSGSATIQFVCGRTTWGSDLHRPMAGWPQAVSRQQLAVRILPVQILPYLSI